MEKPPNVFLRLLLAFAQEEEKGTAFFLSNNKPFPSGFPLTRERERERERAAEKQACPLAGSGTHLARLHLTSSGAARWLPRRRRAQASTAAPEWRNENIRRRLSPPPLLSLHSRFPGRAARVLGKRVRAAATVVVAATNDQRRRVP